MSFNPNTKGRKLKIIIMKLKYILNKNSKKRLKKLNRNIKLRINKIGYAAI
jgi:hypothetical protein